MNCCNEMDIITEVSGLMVCVNCATEHGYKMCDGWYGESTFYYKPMHDRNRWFRDIAFKHIDYSYINTLVNNFRDVVDVMREKNLIKGRNVSQYRYYLIRLASRLGIKILKPIKDTKTPRVKKIFDDRLFGIVYPELGWDINCPYFRTWAKKPLMNKIVVQHDIEFVINEDLPKQKPMYDEAFLNYVNGDEFRRMTRQRGPRSRAPHPDR